MYVFVSTSQVTEAWDCGNSCVVRCGKWAVNSRLNDKSFQNCWKVCHLYNWDIQRIKKKKQPQKQTAEHCRNWCIVPAQMHVVKMYWNAIIHVTLCFVNFVVVSLYVSHNAVYIQCIIWALRWTIDEEIKQCEFDYCLVFLTLQ